MAILVGIYPHIRTKRDLCPPLNDKDIKRAYNCEALAFLGQRLRGQEWVLKDESTLLMLKFRLGETPAAKWAGSMVPKLLYAYELPPDDIKLLSQLWQPYQQYSHRIRKFLPKQPMKATELQKLPIHKQLPDDELFEIRIPEGKHGKVFRDANYDTNLDIAERQLVNKLADDLAPLDDIKRRVKEIDLS